MISNFTHPPIESIILRFVLFFLRSVIPLKFYVYHLKRNKKVRENLIKNKKRERERARAYADTFQVRLSSLVCRLLRRVLFVGLRRLWRMQS